MALWCINSLFYLPLQENCSTSTLDSFLAGIRSHCRLQWSWAKKWLRPWAAQQANTLPTSSDCATLPSCIWEGDPQFLAFLNFWSYSSLKSSTFKGLQSGTFGDCWFYMCLMSLLATWLLQHPTCTNIVIIRREYIPVGLEQTPG